MGGTASSGLALIVPIACLVLAIVCMVAVLKRFIPTGTPRGAAADPIEGGQSDTDTNASLSAHGFALGPQALLQAQKLKESGAPMEEICNALHAGFGDLGETKQQLFRNILQSALSGKLATPFSVDVKLNSFGTHEGFHLDEKSLAQAQGLHAGGATVEDICRAMKPDYADLDPAQQEKFKHVVSTLLRLGGIHFPDAPP